ncbi:hypothetical protein TYRP_015194 [Tyrophagus putrescentiae]|nr:hypothetical protein TYRP_015194 [Tyrophagus putrescentiae]
MASLQKLFECRKRGRAPAETATTTEEEIIILDDSDDEEEEEEEEEEVLYTTVSLFCPREECTANREAVGNLASQKAMRRHLASVHQLKAYVCHVRDCGHKHYHLFHVPGVYACSAPGCGLTLTGFLNQINHHWSKEHPVLKMQLLRQETEQKRELLQEPKQQQQQQSIEKVEGKEGAGGKEEDGEEEIVEVGGGGGGGAGVASSSAKSVCKLPKKVITCFVQ